MKTRSPESSWEFEEEQIFYRIQAARLLAATQHQKEALEMLNEAMDAASRKPEVEDDDINILQALDCKANCMRATGDKRGSWDTYQTLLMMLQVCVWTFLIMFHPVACTSIRSIHMTNQSVRL